MLKKLICIYLLMITFFASANTRIDQEFTRFYQSDRLAFNKCGMNIKYFLSHLKNKNIDLTGGYVVSIHEGMGLLNHFEGRWGRPDTYENGVSYSRSNWYFHVFAVIDGMAYDFSHESNQAMPLAEYLKRSYIPKYRTNTIFIAGKLDQKKVLEKFLEVKMKIYPLDTYENKMGPSVYEGKFYELFSSVGYSVPEKKLERNSENIPRYLPRTYGSMKLGESGDFIRASLVDEKNKVSILNDLSLELLGDSYGIDATASVLCRALGYPGSATVYTKQKEVTDKEGRLTELNCSYYPRRESQELGIEDTKCSFRYIKNDQHYNRKVLKQVGCTSFQDFLSNKL